MSPSEHAAPDEASAAGSSAHTRRNLWIGAHALAAGAIVLMACSSGEPSTNDAIDAGTLSTTADTGSLIVAGTPSSTDATEPVVSQGVSFRSDVMPILESSCASCHASGGPGAAHLVLDTAQDAKDNAVYIASAADVGYMPPWPAADGDLAFHGDRRLDGQQRSAVLEWFEEGAGLDVAPDTAIVATERTVVSIERDIVITGAPYKGSTANRDDYRCQIYDPGLEAEQYLQGFGFEADRTEVVHHALLFRAQAATRDAFDGIDASDPAVGWECGGLVGSGASTDSVQQILSWAPGQDPTILPLDTGLPMQAGDFFIAQIHYHYEPVWDSLEPDESSLVLDFASPDVLAAAGGSLDPIELTLYLGPAEIPCSLDQTGPLCDRQAAANALRGGGGIANALMSQCGSTPQDFAGMTSGVATATCDLPATPGQIVSVWGHMHELGSAYRMVLNPATPGEMVLLDIPKWDFDWQLNYSPIDDVVLVAGDIIRVECTWDRSVAPHGAEPKYVMWAEGTEDEMCYSQIITRPVVETEP
jgi:hypothetical protein